MQNLLVSLAVIVAARSARANNGPALLFLDFYTHSPTHALTEPDSLDGEAGGQPARYLVDSTLVERDATRTIMTVIESVYPGEVIYIHAHSVAELKSHLTTRLAKVQSLSHVFLAAEGSGSPKGMTLQLGPGDSLEFHLPELVGAQEAVAELNAQAFEALETIREKVQDETFLYIQSRDLLVGDESTQIQKQDLLRKAAGITNGSVYANFTTGGLLNYDTWKGMLRTGVEIVGFIGGIGMIVGLPWGGATAIVAPTIGTAIGLAFYSAFVWGLIADRGRLSIYVNGKVVQSRNIRERKAYMSIFLRSIRP